MKKHIMLSALACISFAPSAFAGVTVFDDGESKLKLSGLVRVDAISNKITSVAGGIPTTTKTQGFDLNRAYLTAKYTIDADNMMRITTDVKYESALTGKKSNIFLKYAYLQSKLAGDAAVLRLGVSHTPWVDYELALWKHAYFIDEPSSTFGYEASSDLGIGLKGKLANGMVKYFVTAVNGKGYADIKKSNGIDYSGRIGLEPIKGLTFDVGYRTGYKGTKTSAIVPLGKQTLTRAMISYGTDSFRIGVDYMINKDKTVAAPFEDKLMSGWGWVKLGAGFGLVARYDQEKSNKLVAVLGDVEQKTDQIVAGLTYKRAKNVNFTLGYMGKKFTGYKYVLNDTYKDTRIGLWSQFAY
ncbi:hypothetical protein D8Y20_06910 [Mariprofundus sp. EBB-1]|uniref:hypothetical protein n=1 Tax=Mariprofundus sp. EBB-1 TaxID=2650971 RepID=UPI000EF19A69|nr:hypothetical protein [Mariprofundus sp. EBB-1]RLL52731.1 hypothetical protein D8Y20_06910 [Mariprofundus sp. EBB-1]